MNMSVEQKSPRRLNTLKQDMTHLKVKASVLLHISYLKVKADVSLHSHFV